MTKLQKLLMVALVAGAFLTAGVANAEDAAPAAHHEHHHGHHHGHKHHGHKHAMHHQEHAEHHAMADHHGDFDHLNH
jgi:hypothetical protein